VRLDVRVGVQGAPKIDDPIGRGGVRSRQCGAGGCRAYVKADVVQPQGLSVEDTVDTMEAEEESPHKVLSKVLREVERTKMVPHLKLLPFGLAMLPRGRGKR
jgi:hypothetical protein